MCGFHNTRSGPGANGLRTKIANGNVRTVRKSAETGWGGPGERAFYSEGSSIRGTNSALVAGGNHGLRVSRSSKVYSPNLRSKKQGRAWSWCWVVEPTAWQTGAALANLNAPSPIRRSSPLEGLMPSLRGRGNLDRGPQASTRHVVADDHMRTHPKSRTPTMR